VLGLTLLAHRIGRSRVHYTGRDGSRGLAVQQHVSAPALDQGHRPTALDRGLALFAFPVLWMLSTSLKPLREALTSPPVWLPSTIQWQNYVATIEYIPFLRYTINTVVVCRAGHARHDAVERARRVQFHAPGMAGRNLLFGLTLGRR
jgi:hypothetical protein